MAEMHVAFSLLREALLSRRDSQQHEASVTADALNSSSNSSSDNSNSHSSAVGAVTVVKMDTPQLVHTSDNAVVLTWPPAQLLTQVRFHLASMMYHLQTSHAMFIYTSINVIQAACNVQAVCLCRSVACIKHRCQS
jgi:hypothetical protein